jgi:hypothetical protein
MTGVREAMGQKMDRDRWLKQGENSVVIDMGDKKKLPIKDMKGRSGYYKSIK